MIEWFILNGYKILYNPSTGEFKAYTKSGTKELVQKVDRYRYLRIQFSKKQIRVHKIITDKLFGNCPEGYCVNHINGDKLDNRIINLEYITKGDNTRHAMLTGLIKTRAPKSSDYSKQYYLKNKERIKEKVKQYKVANKDLVKVKRKQDYWNNRDYYLNSVKKWREGRKLLPAENHNTGEF